MEGEPSVIRRFPPPPSHGAAVEPLPYARKVMIARTVRPLNFAFRLVPMAYSSRQLPIENRVIISLNGRNSNGRYSLLPRGWSHTTLRRPVTTKSFPRAARARPVAVFGAPI